MHIRIMDRRQRFSARIDLCDPHLFDVAGHPQADALLGCAVHAVLAALAAGTAWPHDLAAVLSDFMREMREHIGAEHAA